MKDSKYLQRAGLIFASILLSLFIAEGVLQILSSDEEKIYVWQPNLHHVFYPDTNIFYGIKGAKNFTINRQGFRGNEFNEDNSKKYLCIGGSTTECLCLDDKETWWHRAELLCNIVLRDLGNVKTQFGSIGKSGCTTREHYIQLKYFVPQLGKIDGVVMMVGLNDMMKRLSQDSVFEANFRFTQESEDSFVNHIFVSSSTQTSWWRKLKLTQILQHFLHQHKTVKWENVQDDTGQIYANWRQRRANAVRYLDSLPDLTNALNEYERNLALIYEQCQRQNIKLVLINQATLYKDSMNTFENKLLWMGGKGDFQTGPRTVYYSTSALNKAMGLYNQRLKTFCAEKTDIKFIDLAAQLPKDTSVFYDDCHFNEGGSGQVATVIAKSLLE